MDKLRAMERFARIVERGSLTAAAADCATSLPSMVRSLATLERSLGVTLLNRTTRRVSATDEGRQYYEYCKLILGQMHQADAALASRVVAPRGKLAVTASVMFGRRYVAAIAADFLQRHADVTVDLLSLTASSISSRRASTSRGGTARWVIHPWWPFPSGTFAALSAQARRICRPPALRA